MIHFFDSTSEAYDACNCDPIVNRGDTILIPDEHVVGVADTWPFAITKNNGSLHKVVEGADLENREDEFTGFEGDDLRRAVRLATKLRWEIDPNFNKYRG